MKKNTLDMLVEAVTETDDPACAQIGAKAIKKLQRTYLLACLMGGKMDLAREVTREAFAPGLRQAVLATSYLIPGPVLKHALSFVWKIGRRRHYRVLRSLQTPQTTIYLE